MMKTQLIAFGFQLANNPKVRIYVWIEWKVYMTKGMYLLCKNAASAIMVNNYSSISKTQYHSSELCRTFFKSIEKSKNIGTWDVFALTADHSFQMVRFNLNNVLVL